ncbi:uncharacterized protein LOC108710512 isoform X2 [Xenopus laevis]|uniref:Uncharacterized protein LOC108710512 isoform X2 n=1 Tax=Xenopus laevis TaxID=8355 RepID=A0A8J1MQK6_XENLA|nr:uncharacterized protein LOC108710512 isoform X2 [Xenopus laevis]
MGHIIFSPEQDKAFIAFLQAKIMQQFPFHFKEETFTLTLKMREEDKSVNHTLFSLDPCIKETYLNDSAFTCPEPHYRPTFLDQPSEIPRQPCIKETYLYDSTVIRPQPHYRPILLDQPSENPRHPRESYFQSPLLYDSTFSPPEAHSRPTLWGQTSENPRQPFIRETYLHDSGLACPQPRYRPTLWDQPNKNPSLFMKPQLDISGMKCSDTVYRTSPVWADPSTTGIHNLPVLSEVFGTKKKKKTKHNNKRADAVTRHIEDIKRRQNKIDNVDFLKNQLDIPGMISSKTVYRTPPVWAAPSSTGLGPTPDEPFGENKGRKKYCDFKRVNPVFHHLDEQKRNQSKLDKMKKVTWGDDGTSSKSSMKVPTDTYSYQPEDFPFLPKREDPDFSSFGSSALITHVEDSFLGHSPAEELPCTHVEQKMMWSWPYVAEE